MLIGTIPIQAIEIPDNWILEGDTVYVNDNNVHISVNPAYSSGGWVNLNFTSKNYSGDIDLAFGFDRWGIKPTELQIKATREIELSISDLYFDDPLYKYNVSDKVLQLWTMDGGDLPNNETLILDDWVPTGSYKFDRASIQERKIFWLEEYWREYAKDNFIKLPFEYGGMDTWYYTTFNIQKDVEYQARFWLKSPMSLGRSTSKYWVAFKPSGESIQEAISLSHFYALDPWLSNDWEFRKSHEINKTTGAGTDYQVGIKVYYGTGTDGTETVNGIPMGKVYLDSKSQTDFDDIRFTDNDGNTELDYFLQEKTDSTSATFWVEVADDLGAANVTIYVYYGNVGASSTSNGDNTFVDFDDFEDADYSEWTVVGTILTSSSWWFTGEKSATWSINGNRLNKTVTYTAHAVHLWIWNATDYNDAGEILSVVDENAATPKVGQHDGTNLTHYIYEKDGDPRAASAVAQVDTWMPLELRLSTSGIAGVIDGVTAFSGSVGQQSREIVLGNYWNAMDDGGKMDTFFVRKFANPDPVHGVWGAVESEIPTIISATITDFDDSDNLYAMKQFYTFVVVVNKTTPLSNFSKVHLRGLDGATVVFEVKATSLNGTAAYAIEYNATEIDIDAGNSDYSIAGLIGTVTFKIRAEWDISQVDDGELSVYVELDNSASAGFSEVRTNYYDIITRLVSTGYDQLDSRINTNSATYLSGSIRYATTTGGNTASTSYPGDAQFNSVDFQNASHAEHGSDSSIVNGVFNDTVTVPNAVQSNTYHLFLDLVADYTPADAPDGDTQSVIGDRIRILTLTSNVSTSLLNGYAQISATADLEYDGHSLGASDTFFIENTNFTWDSGDSKFEANVTSTTAQTITWNTFNNGSEATFGITVGDMNGKSASVTWGLLFADSVTITNIESSNYLFASNTYLFAGTYRGANDTFRIAFDDGIVFINMSYDRQALSFNLDSGSTQANLLSVTFAESAGTQTVTFRVFITDQINDVLDRDIHIWVNDTEGNLDGWNEVRTNYLNIYNRGGLTESSFDGGAGLVAGGNIFSIAVQNSTTGDFGRVNVTWRKFQHLSLLVHVFQSTAFAGGHWECPTEHNKTATISYGVDYSANGVFIEGWRTDIFVEEGNAGTTGTDDAWVKLNVSWYNRGVFVKSDFIYAFYEAHRIGDGNTQFALWIDLWVDIAEGSSTVGGRVNPVFFGMTESGWGPWSSWGPVANASSLSLFHDDLLDSGDAVISSGQVNLFNVWVSLNKTAQGALTPTCDGHQWALVDYDVFTFGILGATQAMIGIDTPAPNLPRTPEVGAPGLFSSINLAIALMTKQIVNAILQGATVTAFAIASIIDSSFAFFGINNFIGQMTDVLTQFATRFTLGVTTITSLIMSMFIFIEASVIWFSTGLSNVVGVWVELGRVVGTIMDGTYGGQGTNWWALLNWDVIFGSGFATVLITWYWFDTIDQRAKAQGGNWIAIIWGDASILLGMASFFIDMSFTLINFLLSSVFSIMNALDIAARKIFG